MLADGFAELGSDALPLDRPLYVHQEQAIRKAAAGRNVVVATGTGSGKTESFLLPILDSLVREHERGELGPGVRALLLYPMNALANDQMKRLRQVLAAYPDITFGRYTGDTEDDPQEGPRSFRRAQHRRADAAQRDAEPPGDAGDAAAPAADQLRDARVPAAAAARHGAVRDRRGLEVAVHRRRRGARLRRQPGRRDRDAAAAGARPGRAEPAIQCIATSATVGGDAIPAP